MKRRLVVLLEILPRSLLLLAPWVVMAIFLAGVPGGFDFTDEGNYYLSFVHPENVSDNQTSYFLFGGKIFTLLGHNIVAMRLCTLLATLGATLIFLSGARAFVQRFAPELLPDREHRQLAAGCALVASFLGYAISPAALSYNFQNAFCLLAATGFLLKACALSREEKPATWRTAATLGGFGAFVGLEFFIKFSSSIPLAFTGGLFYLLVSGGNPRQKARHASLLLLCGGTLALLYFGFFQNFGRWWTGITGTMGALVHGNYVTTELQRYGNEVATLVGMTLRNFSPVWIIALPAVVGVAALRARPRGQQLVALIAGLWLLVHMVWFLDRLEYQAASCLPFIFGSLLLLGLLAAASRVAVKGAGQNCTPGRWRIFLAAGWFFILPYIGAFGTNNSIHANCFYQLGPWFVVAALLLAELDRIWRTAWPSRLGLLGLAIMVALQFYDGYWLQPYRVSGTRWNQTEPTTIGDPGTTLRLTPATHDFIITSQRILHEHGFKPGDDLLVFFNLPGFVFAMGGSSPGYPWYYEGNPHVFELNAMRLSFIELERRKRAFIVRNGDPARFLPYLHEAGLNFPEDYKLITPPMTSPFTGVPFEIWQPKS